MSKDHSDGPPQGLRDVFDLQELTGVLSHMLGVVAACRTCVASRSLQMSLQNVPRDLAEKMPQRLCAICGIGNRRAKQAYPPVTAESFNSATAVWGELPAPTARYGCAATALQGFIYVVGGCIENDEPLDAAERFDISCNLWQSLPPLLEQRGTCAAASIAGKVYVVGGRTDELLASMESFDPVAICWMPQCPMTIPRSKLAASSTDGTWMPLPPMMTPRFSCASATHAGSVFVAGGCADGWAALSTTERLNLSTGAWQPGPEMRDPRRDFAMVATAAGILFVIGGSSSAARVLRSVERLDMGHGDSWEAAPAMLSARSACTAAAFWL